MSIWGDIVNLITAGAGADVGSGAAQAGAVGSAANLSSDAGIGAALAAFFGDITSIAMWRSLGWLLLGILMMIAGVAWWVKGSVVSGGSLATAAAALA